jgi:hypothetical protein
MNAIRIEARQGEDAQRLRSREPGPRSGIAKLLSLSWFRRPSKETTRDPHLGAKLITVAVAQSTFSNSAMSS